MRDLTYIRNLLVGSIFGALVLVGTALSINAQNQTKEYYDWQRAQARAEQEHQDYLRTGDRRDYNQWQAALRRAEEQRRQYERASNRYNNGYNNGYNNNGYNNNGYYNNSNYNNGYNNNNSGRYRVYRDGSYYSTDSRGAELLRQAVRNGYSQGYRQGQMDRRNSRQFDYTMGTTYRNGSYGYQSYVARDQYQYYFQQGFQKGYDDGYNGTSRYGTRSTNGFNVLGNILNTILNIQN